MKTAAERAEKFVAQSELADISDRRELMFAIYELLKEQDWLTREACAKAIKPAQAEFGDDTPYYRNVCLNAKAV